MSPDRGRSLVWTKRIRLAAALVVVLLLAVMSVVLLKRTARRAPAEKTPAVSSPKVEEKVRIRHVEFRGGRERIELTADRTYVGPDDKHHMVGNVQIIVYGRRDSRRVVIRGEEIVHDDDRFHYLFTGPVIVEFRGLTFITSDVVYDRGQESFRTEKRIDVQSSNLRGGAVGMSYSLRTYALSLDGEPAFEFRAGESETPLSVAGRALTFHQDTRKGEFEGPVTLDRGRSRGSCRRLDFELFAKTDMLSIVYLLGEARLSVRGEPLFPTGGDAGLRTIAGLGDDQDIEAGEIKLRYFQDTDRLHSFESSGGSAIRFLSSSGSRTLFQAERIDFIFDRWGGLREFRSFVGARMDSREAGGKETRSAAGESMIMTGGSDWMTVRPGPGGKARATLDGTEIQADELDFGLEGGDLEARGAKAVFAGRDGDRGVGFFAPGHLMFAAAKEMRYLSRDRRFLFSGRVRLWQEGKTLTAEDFEFEEDTGRASGRGGVRAVFPHRPRNRDVEEKVDISARTLESAPEGKSMTFESEARLRLERAEVRAKEIIVRLGGDGRGLEEIIARDDVIITQTGREGRGRLAVYDNERDEVVLTGRPVLTDKDRGRVEGDKLTFHLSDGTITVENTGRERSITVIKS